MFNRVNLNNFDSDDLSQNGVDEINNQVSKIKLNTSKLIIKIIIIKLDEFQQYGRDLRNLKDSSAGNPNGLNLNINAPKFVPRTYGDVRNNCDLFSPFTQVDSINSINFIYNFHRH